MHSFGANHSVSLLQAYAHLSSSYKCKETIWGFLLKSVAVEFEPHPMAIADVISFGSIDKHNRRRVFDELVRFSEDTAEVFRFGLRISEKYLPNKSEICFDDDKELKCQWAYESLLWRVHDAIESAVLLSDKGLGAECCIAIRAACEAQLLHGHVAKCFENLREVVITSLFQEFCFLDKCLKWESQNVGKVNKKTLDRLHYLSSELQSWGCSSVEKDGKWHFSPKPNGKLPSWVNLVDAEDFTDIVSRTTILDEIFERGNGFAHNRSTLWDGWVTREGNKIRTRATLEGTANRDIISLYSIYFLIKYLLRVKDLRSEMTYDYSGEFGTFLWLSHRRNYRNIEFV